MTEWRDPEADYMDWANEDMRTAGSPTTWSVVVVLILVIISWWIK